MKSSLRSAPVTLGIVQDSLRHPVGLQVRRAESVSALGQRHRAREPRPVQQKRVAGNLRRDGWGHVFQTVIQKSLDSPVGGTQQIPEHQVLLVIVPKERASDLEKCGVAMAAWR